jgi:hypothetical protein
LQQPRRGRHRPRCNNACPRRAPLRKKVCRCAGAVCQRSHGCRAPAYILCAGCKIPDTVADKV